MKSQFPSNSAFADFTATSLACVVANLFTHPFEMLKVRQQIYASASKTSAEPNLIRLIAEIARTEGPIRPFYSGLSAGLWRAVISGGGRLALYNQFKLVLGEDRMAQSGVATRISLGVLAGGLAAVFAVPFDLVRTRQQSFKQSSPAAATSSSATSAPGMFQVIRDIVNKEGVRGLWAGSSATFVRQAIFTAAQFTSYDQAKLFAIRQSNGSLGPDSVATHVFAAVVSGAVSTLTTAPIEMVKTQMQLVGKRAGASAGAADASFASIVRQVTRDHGLAGFWRGSGALYFRLAPHTTLVFVGTEYFRNLFGVTMAA